VTKTFWGYPRADGTIGTRNKVLVLATVHCCYIPAVEIVKFSPDAVAVTHYWNCRSTGEGQETVVNCLVEMCKHPNVGAVFIVGLGCEEISTTLLSERISDCEKPYETIVCQDLGSVRAIEKGRELLASLVERTAVEKRKKVSARHLKVAIQCGASDYSSGLYSNPAVGKAVDYVIEAGGTVIFGEVAELIGVEDVLVRRAASGSVAKKIESAIQEERRRWRSLERSFNSHGNHGNVRGGLSTIEEKSCGAVLKTGSKTVDDVLEYSSQRIEKPIRPGLYLQNQNGYGSDVGSITAMAAAGAQIAVFTTGSGSIVGHAIIPVFKVTANEETYNNMADNIDYFVSPNITSSKDSLVKEGLQIFNSIMEVANGKQTKAEELCQDDFAVLRISPL
jgi:altronate dehydratase large subunit